MRLAEGADLNEKGCRREDCADRVLVGDSWFASFETAKALRDKLNVHFVGNIKTAHRKFPQDQLRWDLSRLERGGHVIYKEKETGMFAVGWQDNHYKTFVTTCGESEAGAPAQKKRQRDDGSNYWRDVKRPRALETFYKASGAIDQHNACRQGLLKLENFWKTKRWQTRIVTSIFSSTLVGSSKAWEVYHPPSDTPLCPILESRLQGFVVKLIGELSDGTVDPDACNEDECELVSIGTSTVQEGDNKGRTYATQMRCTECVKGKRKIRDGRCRKTKWKCRLHPNVYLCPASKGPCFSVHCNQVSV
jgi:hypothetical protein